MTHRGQKRLYLNGLSTDGASHQSTFSTIWSGKYKSFWFKKSNHFFMHDRIDVRNKWVQFARNYDLTPSVADVYWKIEWTKEI